MKFDRLTTFCDRYFADQKHWIQQNLLSRKFRLRNLRSILLFACVVIVVSLIVFSWMRKPKSRLKLFSPVTKIPSKEESDICEYVDATNSRKSGNILSLCCDDVCLRLRNRMKNWPEGKPKALVYYLIHSDRLFKFRRSLSLLDVHFNNGHHYPVVIFHENISAEEQNRIRLSTKSEISFQTVSFKIPEFLPQDLQQVTCPREIGYRHMCRFHSKLVYEQPIIKGFEYALRLDDDSEILRPITYDIFEYMRNRNLQYGHIFYDKDDHDCVLNLWENATKYIESASITPTFFNEWDKYKIFYNNFEVSRLSFWFSDEYKRFIEYLDRLGGIYYHRWGDAPMKTIAVSIFISRNQTHLFKDIGYRHTWMQIL